MFRPIRMDHTNCLQVAIKTLQFNSILQRTPTRIKRRYCCITVLHYSGIHEPWDDVFTACYFSSSLDYLLVVAYIS
jgi:hypothetical protein